MNIYDQILNDIQKEYYQHNFPNNGPRFVAWYLRNIYHCSIDEAKFDITDGADDKQIDAVHIDEENCKVYIIQGKFIGTTIIDAEPLREVISSWVQIKNLVKVQENCNAKLQQKLSDISYALEEDNYEIVFELLTTAVLSDAAKNDLTVFQEELAKPDDITCTLNLIDSEELQRRYDLALEKDHPIIKHHLKLEPGKYMKMDVAGTKSILAAIHLKDCLSFPGIKDGTLFRKNVRQSLRIKTC